MIVVYIKCCDEKNIVLSFLQSPSCIRDTPFINCLFYFTFFHVSCLVPLTFLRMSSILVTSAGGDDNAVQTEGTAKAAEHVAGRFEQSCECVASDDREP